MSEQTGHAALPGGNVFYRIAGSNSPGAPLLVLHGGPGAGHDYMEPLADLSDTRPVVFYDQLGCGRSDIPDDESLWRVERFVEEVGAVRKALALERVHLLGQSWGGFLALEYMLTKPAGAISLTLADTSASAQDFASDARSRVSELPPDVRDTIERCEAAGDLQSPEYEAATMVFYQNFLCRIDPFPEYVMRSMANLAASPVYGYMWGPTEFNVSGTLEGWDVSARLGEITTPTLIVAGKYDEAGPACQQTLKSGIPDATLHIFQNSSHMPHAEEREEYRRVVSDFLARHDSV